MGHGAEEWPIVITNRCADACAEAFAIPDRGLARDWLTERIIRHGVVTAELPGPLAGRRSPSGYFLLVDGVLVLPLAADRDGRPQWIATNCLAHPHDRHGAAGGADIFALSGHDLLAQVNMLPHAVERFQQRCGGHRDLDRARHDLLERLAPTVRAVRRPPSWCTTRRAEFYLVAGADDEYCLPCRTGSGARPFDVTTCIHRAGDLFELTGSRLAACCRRDPAASPSNGSYRDRLLNRAFRFGGRLSWHRPRWAKPHPAARWWIVFHERIAAPVSWEPDAERPLLILQVADHRPLLVRWFANLRHRFGSQQ